MIRGIGGDLVTFHLSLSTLVRPDNRFWNTKCQFPSSNPPPLLYLTFPSLPLGRKTPEYQGGFLLDGGVHSLAGLRLLLAAVSVSSGDLKVACFSALQQPRLLPVDTVRAVASTPSGASGLVSLSFGTEFKGGLEIEIVTTEGRVTWTPTQIRAVRRSRLAEETWDIERDNGIPAEFEAFARDVEAGATAPNPLQTPQEALADLRLLEALLRSGESGAAVTAVVA